ncbi:ribonucleoside reductase class II [Mycobacterium phage UnionJack]|uniref:Uncharacterized protein n=1 Tax=Mycobacterium phage UnionJack TaxID=1673876 RepID=A0A0K1LJS0_9CAUD|nr:ribonucleoside reductase class II [Mycobacterium phage UnionJack]AKU42395.1 hypothetical protein UNIONJACK_43 [Mycobacterium phage UnionJack]
MTLPGNDPWATAPAEPDQPPPPPAQGTESPWDTTPPEAQKPAAPVQVINKSDEGKVVLTFKEAAGFDASWIVVHANSVQEANDILDDHVALQALMAKTKKVAEFYRGGAPSSGGNGGGGGRKGQPAAAKQPPPGTPPAPDSSYEYKSGTKNGKFWHGWFPPKNSGKDVVWLPTD